jgi:N-acetylneuraminate synthase/N,N'-diacetyllegionaminate synthase
MPTVKIGDRTIPTQRDVYVIAEAGVNHNGEPDLAHQLIDVAARSGADAVKFQTFSPDKLVSATAATTPYQRQRGGSGDQRSMLEALTLPTSAWKDLQAHASESGITFLSTPFDLESAEMLVELGLPALKVGSGELTNLPFLRSLSSMGVTLLVSTGMGTEIEVTAAVDACAEAPGLILFHCVSAYPAPIDQCNLRAIASMRRQYDVPVGWSDHTPGLVTALGAVALGANILEKHFTVDRNLPGPDHLASLEPAELGQYVSSTKELALGLGDGVKARMPAEEENAALVRRSWHAATDLPAGTVLTHDHLALLRPEGGISPGIEIAGAILVRSVTAGSPITASDLSPTQ